MLRLKVECFMKQYRSELREKQLQWSRVNLKNENEFKFTNSELIKDFSEEELIQIYQTSLLSQEYSLRNNNLTKLLNFYKNHSQKASKYKLILLLIFQILVKKISNDEFQNQQLQAYQFLFEILKNQEIEYLDFAIEGIYNLTLINTAAFYKVDLLSTIVDLVNLQIPDICIDKICFILEKVAKQIQQDEICKAIYTSEFLCSINYYFTKDPSSVMNLLLHLLNCNLAKILLKQQTFLVTILQLLDCQQMELKIKVIVSISQLIFLLKYLMAELEEEDLNNDVISQIAQKLISLKFLNNKCLNQQLQEISTMLNKKKLNEKYFSILHSLAHLKESKNKY